MKRPTLSRRTTAHARPSPRHAVVFEPFGLSAVSLAAQLSLLGYFATVFAERIGAASWVRETPCELALIDYQGNIEATLALIAEVRARCPGVLIVMMTTWAPEAVEDEILDAADRVLIKPFALPEMRALLRPRGNSRWDGGALGGIGCWDAGGSDT